MPRKTIKRGKIVVDLNKLSSHELALIMAQGMSHYLSTSKGRKAMTKQEEKEAALLRAILKRKDIWDKARANVKAKMKRRAQAKAKRRQRKR